MKKRGGSLDNQMLYYTVTVIAILNLIAYLSVGDWRSILWFVVAGICMFVLTSNHSISILVAILGGAISRSVYVEGMTPDKTDAKPDDKKDKKPTDKAKVTDKVTETKPEPLDKKPDLDLHSLKNIMSGAHMEGLANRAEKLTKTNNQLSSTIEGLGPLIKETNQMINSLPEGFLAEAMKNFNQMRK